MAFDDTCAQCTYLDPSGENKGKFPCTNPKSGFKVVSARMRKSNCNVYCAIGVGKRTTRECRELEAISKRYGYYILTALYEILGLTNTKYMSSFMYIKDVFMPMMEEYEPFLEEYEVNGPQIAQRLIDSEDSVEEAQYLIDEYLDEFSDLVYLERPDEASGLFIRMYDGLLYKFGIPSTRIKPKKLTIEGSKPVNQDKLEG